MWEEGQTGAGEALQIATPRHVWVARRLDPAAGVPGTSRLADTISQAWLNIAPPFVGQSAGTRLPLARMVAPGEDGRDWAARGATMRPAGIQPLIAPPKRQGARDAQVRTGVAAAFPLADGISRARLNVAPPFVGRSAGTHLPLARMVAPQEAGQDWAANASTKRPAGALSLIAPLQRQGARDAQVRTGVAAASPLARMVAPGEDGRDWAARTSTRRPAIDQPLIAPPRRQGARNTQPSQPFGMFGVERAHAFAPPQRATFAPALVAPFASHLFTPRQTTAASQTTSAMLHRVARAMPGAYVARASRQNVGDSHATDGREASRQIDPALIPVFVTASLQRFSGRLIRPESRQQPQGTSTVARYAQPEQPLLAWPAKGLRSQARIAARDSATRPGELIERILQRSAPAFDDRRSTIDGGASSIVYRPPSDEPGSKLRLAALRAPHGPLNRLVDHRSEAFVQRWASALARQLEHVATRWPGAPMAEAGLSGDPAIAPATAIMRSPLDMELGARRSFARSVPPMLETVLRRAHTQPAEGIGSSVQNANGRPIGREFNRPQQSAPLVIAQRAPDTQAGSHTEQPAQPATAALDLLTPVGRNAAIQREPEAAPNRQSSTTLMRQQGNVEEMAIGAQDDQEHIDLLARQVYTRLRQRLLVEAERLGR